MQKLDTKLKSFAYQNSAQEEASKVDRVESPVSGAVTAERSVMAPLAEGRENSRGAILTTPDSSRIKSRLRVGDVMATKVVTIPSNTSLAEAHRIMEASGLRRLPVVDKGKLVGIVTKGELEKAGPSRLTTFSRHELSYLLGKIKVREAMRKDVLTGAPELPIEEAVALVQSSGRGSMVVLEEERVVGILSNADIFLKVVNPLLGIALEPAR